LNDDDAVGVDHRLGP